MYPKYRYNLIKTNGSSMKYGSCEVCGEYVDDVWHQVERKYLYPPSGYTLNGCSNIFGHKDCLTSKRR